MALEIANLIRAMAFFYPGGFNPDFPDGYATQVVGIRQIYRLNLGQYAVALQQPAEFTVLPAPGSTHTVGLLFADCMPVVTCGVPGVTLAATFVPSDVPAIPEAIRGAIVITATDAAGEATDEFSCQLIVVDAPNNGARPQEPAMIAILPDYA